MEEDKDKDLFNIIKEKVNQKDEKGKEKENPNKGLKKL